MLGLLGGGEATALAADVGLATGQVVAGPVERAPFGVPDEEALHLNVVLQREKLV